MSYLIWLPCTPPYSPHNTLSLDLYVFCFGIEYICLGRVDCRHNYAAILIVRACLDQLKGIQNVAFFDSSFHMSLEKKRWMYPIDPKLAESKGIRKYGFHGLSYSFIIRAVAKYLNKVRSLPLLITPKISAAVISRGC